MRAKGRLVHHARAGHKRQPGRLVHHHHPDQGTAKGGATIKRRKKA